jgi:hypothetical protein
MNDFSFENQDPYTPPLGDAANFTFPEVIPPEDEVQASAAQEIFVQYGQAENTILEVSLVISDAQGIFVQYGQAENTVFEDPIIEVESSSASLLSVFSGFATSTIVEVVSRASSAVGISKSFGVVNSSYLIAQVASSSNATLYSILSFESCSSRIDVEYTTGRDFGYRYVEPTAIPKGFVNIGLSPAKGIAKLDNSYKKGRFKANYLPYGNVYETPVEFPPSVLKTFLSSSLYPAINVDTLSVYNPPNTLSARFTNQEVPPLDTLQITASLNSITIRQLLKTYPVPPEVLSISPALQDAVLRQILLTYQVPAENLAVSFSFSSASLDTKLITYTNYQPENLSVAFNLNGVSLL